MFRAKALTALLVIAFALISNGKQPVLQIERVSGSLAAKVEKIARSQFGPESNRLRVPSTEEQKLWRGILDSLINNRPRQASELLARAGFPYKLVIFSDTSTKREYTVLEEDPQKYGWGFFVFDLKSGNPLVIEVPHPVSDSGTESQGIEAFLETRARAFLLSGTHRRANPKESPCTQATEESDYAESDPAHNVNSMFHRTHEAIVDARPETVAVQLHGMKERDVCPNVFLSTGTGIVTGNASRFLGCLKARGVKASVYDGTVSCPLIASTNVQGRFSNGKRENPCADYSEGSPGPGFFIHAEQEPGIRKDAVSWRPVIEALKCAFPANGRPPAGPGTRKGGSREPRR